MTIKEAFIFAALQLKKIDSPQLDAAILLSAAIKKPKEFLYTYPEKKLTAAQIIKFKKFIRRRVKREPVAYILGKKEFYGFEFLVSPAVLIPRPETETLINAILKTVGFPKPCSYPQIIDVGTGSGAIAITLKKLLPKVQVFASDISPRSLALAKKNASRLKSKITLKKGNLLSPFYSVIPHLMRDPGDIIITANLPYLSRAEWQKTAPEVKKYEPKSALVGGKTGTEIYKKLFRELKKIIHSPSASLRSAQDTKILIFVEIGHNQKPAIAKLAKKILKPAKIEFIKDLAGKWRVAKIVASGKY